MKVRIGFVSNSSSCSFVIYTGDMIERFREEVIEFISGGLVDKLSFDRDYYDECDVGDAIYGKVSGNFIWLNGEEVYGCCEEIKQALIAFGVQEKWIGGV
jgi:hypothetical protein